MTVEFWIWPDKGCTNLSNTTPHTYTHTLDKQVASKKEKNYSEMSAS